MEKFSKFLGARLARRQREVDAHPDADLLTAFAESRLEKDERATVLGHLASCANCREVAALVATDSGAVDAKSVNFGWWHLRWVAALAAACLVTMVVWHPGKMTKPAAVNETKEARQAPAPSHEILAAAPPGPIEKRRDPVKKKASTVTMISASKPQDSVLPVQPDEIQIPKTIPFAPLPLAKSLDQAAPARQSAGLAANARAGTAMAFSRFSARRAQSLWEIDSERGMLRRSSDGGRSWTPVPVNGDRIFLSLSVSGNEIWAGGEGGALFHSLDDGLHWEAVAVGNGEQRVNAEITGIQAMGLSLKVITKVGVWTSSDGGVSWRRE